MKWLLLAFGLCCACGCKNDEGAQAGSQTHFLSDCASSCPSPLSCICGVCTVACDESHDCSGTHDGATCQGPVPTSSSCPPSTLSCDFGCSGDGACSELGSGFACVQGRCRQVQSGGTGGKGGTGGSAAGGTGGAAGTGTPTGGTGPQAGKGGSGGSTSGGECTDSSECVLVPTGCCAACQTTKNDVQAVLESDQQAAIQRNCPGAPVACGPCPPPPAYDPQHPVVRAACMSGVCKVVDLREEPESACKSDDDCHLAGVGCCGSCGADPSGWISLSTAMSDPYAPVCDPIPPCAPCSLDAQPAVFCAPDGHCAVGSQETLDGMPSTTCWSLAQNMDKVHDAGAQGCDCSPADGSITFCIDDGSGNQVRVACSNHWGLINDGAPCP